MQIRLAELTDVPPILQIYETARQLMRTSGNPTQWGDSYPSVEIVTNDIEHEQSYVCIDDDGDIVGVFCYFVGIEPTYNNIYEGKWLNDDPYGVIHRIASSGKHKGIASFCINWCLSNHNNIRIDTHRNNHAMHHLLSKMGFTSCGIIYLENGSERVGYGKERHSNKMI